MICVCSVFYESDADTVGHSISFLEYMITLIAPEAFTEIVEELTRQPITLNRYRNIAGEGRSQTFGVVGRRCLKPDYSRQNWLRPYLFKLLCEFGHRYVDISWNAITVNQNYRAGPHYDKNNVGESYLVAFGNFTGGELELHKEEGLELLDIRHKPVRMDFSKVLHSVSGFEGQRFSLVFYWYDLKGAELPPCSVKEVNGKWQFFRGEEMITKKKGLPHPLRKLKPGEYEILA